MVTFDTKMLTLGFLVFRTDDWDPWGLHLVLGLMIWDLSNHTVCIINTVNVRNRNVRISAFLEMVRLLNCSDFRHSRPFGMTKKDKPNKLV